MTRRGDWMQTFTGRQFWPLDPRPDEIHLADIAHHLSMRARYGGAAKRYYSVAEHCVIVSLFVPPEFAREGLLHDGSEAYIGDMVRPLKHQPELAGFREIEDRLETMIYERFRITRTAESHAAVKLVDNRILADERRRLLTKPPVPWTETEPALGTTIACLAPAAAEWVYLQRFAELFPDFAPEAARAMYPHDGVTR